MKHERRWRSDSLPGKGRAAETSSSSSAGTSPVSDSRSSTPAATTTEDFVEVTLDLQDDDTIILRSVEPATVIDIGGEGADHESGGTELLPRSTPTSAPTSRSPTIKRSSSNKLRQFSQELKADAVAKARQFSLDVKAELRRFSRSRGGTASRNNNNNNPESNNGVAGFESALAARALRKQRAQLDRTRTSAHKALRGLKFISKRKSQGVEAWNEVASNFDKLAVDGYLHRADFAQCIGMRDSKEFALELFDGLSRRRRLKVEKLSKEELYEFWSQITDDSFDSRLQIFFDMVDKNEDGRLTEEDVKEIIMLSASANKLSRLKEQAEEYAALIMEELDPERLGYIEVGPYPTFMCSLTLILVLEAIALNCINI
ncbi:Respiratory burst oxidase homolog protein A [Linum grandiflorum]